MKAFSLILIFIFCVSCNNKTSDLDKYKYGQIEVYIDNSNVSDFELKFIYNKFTHIENGDFTQKKIDVDSLIFKIDSTGVDKGLVYNKNIIKIYHRKNIRVVLSNKDSIIESYNVNIPSFKYLRNIKISDDFYNNDYRKGDSKVNYSYVLNPLSLSKYKLDTISYQNFGFNFFSPISKKLEGNFISLNLIDWWFTEPHQSIRYKKSVNPEKTSKIKTVKISKI